MKFDITGSIVTYKNDPVILQKAIQSFLNTSLAVKLYVCDNSPTEKLKTLVQDPRCEYIFNGANIGFGAAHNICIRKAFHESDFHLVLNPDVSFPAGTLEHIHAYMMAHADVGLVLPKVVGFDAEMHFVCKRLPAPLDLIVRRLDIGILKKLFAKRLSFYEMRDKNYDEVIEAPSLSGCFMLFRNAALKQAGLFDERFFMYMEDIDLARRVYQKFRNVYLPTATIIHGHAKESYKSFRLLKIHALSAIRYFNKWGWFFDRERNQINTKV